MKLDWKLTLITFTAFIALSPVISTVHEYGHAFVCAGNGYNYLIQPSLFGTYFSCDKFVGEGSDQLRTQMYLYGGMFGAGTAFLLFMALRTFRVFKGRIKGVAFALVTIGTMQFVQMILETFAHDLYMDSRFTIVVMSMLSLIILITLLSRGSKQFLEGRVFTNPPYSKETKYRDDIPDSIFKRDITDIIKGNKPTPKTQTRKPPRKHSLDVLKENQDEVQ